MRCIALCFSDGRVAFGVSVVSGAGGLISFDGQGLLPVTAELFSHDGSRSTGQPRQSVARDKIVDLTAVSRGEGASSSASSPVLPPSAAPPVPSAMPLGTGAAAVGSPAGAGAGAGVAPHGVPAARSAGGRRLGHGAFQRAADTVRAGKKGADESWVMGRLATVSGSHLSVCFFVTVSWFSTRFRDAALSEMGGGAVEARGPFPLTPHVLLNNPQCRGTSLPTDRQSSKAVLEDGVSMRVVIIAAVLRPHLGLVLEMIPSRPCPDLWSLLWVGGILGGGYW